MEEVQVPKVPVPLYSVAGLPFLGMVSAMDSAAIPEGTWSFAQNVRWADGTIRIRGGLTEYRSTAMQSGSLPSGTVAGAMLDGGTSQYLALNVSNAIRIYKFFSSAWGDINASNRLANVERVWMERFTLPAPGVVKTLSHSLSTYSYTVVQDGSSAPLMICNGIGTSTVMTTPIAAIAAPNVNKCEAIPFSMAYLTILGASITNATSSTTVTSGTITAGTVLNLNLNPGATTSASGNLISIGFSKSFVSTQPSQFQIVYNGIVSDIWDNFCIEVADNTNSYVIHLPGVTTYQTDDVGDRYKAAMFDCTSVATNGTSSTISDFISFPSFTATKLKFTYVGTSPVTTVSVPLYAMAFGGNIPFGSQFGVTFYNIATAVESGPAICKNVVPPALKRVGGTPLPGVTLADTPAAKYSYRIQYQEQSTYAVNVYARNGKNYQILDFATAFCTATGKMGASTIHTLSFGRWPMPSYLNREIPIGGPMVTSGDRLYVAQNTATGGALQRSSVAFSEKRFPNRFYVEAEIIDGQVQSRSGGETLFGDETVHALINQSGGLYSGESVFAFTDKSAYQMSGVDAIQLSRPANIGPYGCVSPGSVVRYHNTIIWVTPDRQLVSVGNDIGDLGSRRIEDILLTIPAARLDNIESTVFRDRVYIGYTPLGGSTNTNALVFDMRTQGWSVDSISTLSGASFGKWCPQIVSNESRLVCASSTGWMFEYDVLTGTGTSGDRYVTATTIVQPTLKLTSRTLTKGFTQRSRFGDIMLVADSQGDGVVWDTTLIERQTGTSYAGKINMDGDASKLWRYNRGTTETERVGSIGLGNQVQIEGQGLPNSAIYAISVDNEGETLDGADRA